MCAFLRYSAGGLAALLATAYVAVSADTGARSFHPDAYESGQTVVNRANKGDREMTARKVTNPVKTIKPAEKESKILEGCDPAFSPLTASARNNFANRCVV
jgi:hypothetical protein